MKLKKYKTFEDHIIRYENLMPGHDLNYEDEYDKVISALSKQKSLISMLRDTITYVCGEIEKTLPKEDNFYNNLQHYDEHVFGCVDEIKEIMIDGYPNLKDIMEDIEQDFNDLEKSCYIS